MATLQKFKLLATQCAVAGSPTRSPNTSPGFQLRRRKTLRNFLSRSGSRRLPRRGESSVVEPDRQKVASDPVEKKALLSHSLKDLFVSSPPFEGKAEDAAGHGAGEVVRFPPPVNRNRAGVVRPITAAFRYRLLRKVWRPVLVTIPE